MRTFNRKNKLSFNIFGIMIILLLAVIIVIAVRTMTNESESYGINKGSVIYDESMQPVDVFADGTVDKKWNDKYYLSLGGDNTYSLGEKNVIYDVSSRRLDVLGDGYQVFVNGSVDNIDGKTAVDIDGQARLFKLEDRNYLITGSTIVCEEQNFSTAGYLHVNIDKAGNALLTNDTINLKTVEPMTLTCGGIVFDIANEKLKNEDQEVDLKAIGGSTNEYIADEDTTEDKEKETTSGNSSVNNSNNVTNQQNVISGGSSATGTGGEGSADNDQNLDRSISLRGTSSDVTSITVNYSITDVENKFISTYLLLLKDGEPEEKEQRIGINKADSEITIRNLDPGSQYKISICYDMYIKIDNNNTLTSNTANVVNARTRSIDANIEVTRMTSNTMYATVTLDSDYVLDSVDLVFYEDDSSSPVSTKAINVKKASNGGWSAEIDIKGSDAEKFRLTLENAVYQGEKIDMNVEYVTKTSGVTRLINYILQGLSWKE